MTLNAVALGEPPKEYVDLVYSRLNNSLDRISNPDTVNLLNKFFEVTTDEDFYRNVREIRDKQRRVNNDSNDYYESLAIKQYNVNKMTKEALIGHPKIYSLISNDKLIGYRDENLNPRRVLYKEVYSGYGSANKSCVTTVSGFNKDMSRGDINILRDNYANALSMIALGEDPTDY